MPSTPSVHQGVPAAPGLADGPLVRFQESATGDRDIGSPEDEALTLQAALRNAAEDLTELLAKLADRDPDGSVLLEFQIAFLEDSALSDPALERIAQGEPADEAFSAVINEMAAEYEASGDDYFAARASDIRDMGSRVCGKINGAAGAPPIIGAGDILLARDLPPSVFLSMDWSDGQAIALEEGSPTAHVAILARGRGVPMVVAVGPVCAEDGTHVLLNGESGELVVSPDSATGEAFSRKLEDVARQRESDAIYAPRPGQTATGEKVSVHINIGRPEDLDGLNPAHCDGIGLVRSEFLFHDREGLPDFDEQATAYRRILDWADGRPVIIRTLDAGGDKPIPGLTFDEANPFLGVRGVRLSLKRPEVFEVQLRALVAAASAGNLRIMVPMVALPDELDQVRAMLSAIPGGADIPLGMMVEVPAAALSLSLFRTDFVSIGSNDLTQYTLAAGRDTSALASYQDAANPAVLALVRTVVEQAQRRSIPVSLCGDAGGDPEVLPHLMAAGLRSVSVAAPLVGRTKRVISQWPNSDPDTPD